jgi:hypothetical protein
VYDQFDIGEVATLRVETLNSSGDLAAPVSLDLTITDPSGNASAVAIGGLTLVSTGVYTYALTLDEAGVWSYRFVGAGNAVNFTTTEYLIVGTATETTGPCDLWINPTDVFDLSPASSILAADRDMDLADLCAQAASRILFVLSRERYPGICRHVVRPCRQSSAWWYPAYWSGWNDSWGACGCPTPMQCGCGNPGGILLGAEPVLGVTEVLIDGAAVAAANTWRVDDGRWLVRLDGQGWPTAQNLALATTEVGTFQVTFFSGRTPPADGILAAKRLAGDLYSGASGGDCAMPANLTSRVRQGDTIEFTAEPGADLMSGLLSLRECDVFLAAEYHSRRNGQATTVSPDAMPAVRRTY